MQIETERLRIRPLQLADAADVYAYASDPCAEETMGWPPHSSEEESLEILNRWIADGSRHAIIWKENDRVIGHIAIQADSDEGREDTRELGYILHEDWRRRGIMAEAVRAAVQYLFRHGINRIWASCFQDNLASAALLATCGFQFVREGVFRARSTGKVFSSYEYCLFRDAYGESR